MDANMLGTVGMLVVMLAIFYFMLIRPENKKKKELAKMRSELAVGDEITTIGGIIGYDLRSKGREHCDRDQRGPCAHRICQVGHLH